MHINALLLPTLLVVLQVDASSKEANLAKQFIKGKKEGDALFKDKESFRKRGDLFERIVKSSDSKKYLFRAINLIANNKNPDKADLTRITGMLSLIQEDEFERILSVNSACKIIGPFLGQFSQKLLAKVEDTKCMTTMLNSAAEYFKKDGKHIHNLPSEWINAKVIELIDSNLHQASPAFLKALNVASDFAKHVKPEGFNQMSKEQLKQFNSEFFSNVPHLLKKNIVKAIPLMGDDVFADYKGSVTKENAKAMRKAQLQKFNSKNSEKRCVNIPLEVLSDEQFSALEATCVLSYLKSKNAALLGRKWAQLKSNWLDAVAEEDLAALGHIKDQDKKFIPSTTWNAMLKKSIVCGSIKGNGIFSSDQAIVASGECFAKIRDSSLMIKILMNPAVSEDILAYVDKKIMGKLVMTVGGREYSDFSLIPFMKAASERKSAIISKISTKTDSTEHACSLIDNVDIIHKIKEFDAATVECIEAIRATINEEDYQKSPCLLGALEPEEAMNTYADKWATISQGVLSALLKRGIVSSLSEELIVKGINPDALPAFTGEYVKQITFLNKVPADRIARFADDAFSEFSGDRFTSEIGWSKISNGQFPYVSIRIIDITKRATAKLSSADVKAFDQSFAKFSARQLQAVPAGSWEAVTESVFTTIPAESLTLVTEAQIKSLPEAICLKLTDKQAELIGKDTEVKSSPLMYLYSIRSKIADKAVVGVLEKRTMASQDADEPSSASTLSITSSTFIAIGSIVMMALFL